MSVLDCLDDQVKHWPSPIVARQEISKFTGGAISPRTMANYDCRGEGPEGRDLLNGKVVYPLDKLIEWLKRRVKKVEGRKASCPAKKVIALPKMRVKAKERHLSKQGKGWRGGRSETDGGRSVMLRWTR